MDRKEAQIRRKKWNALEMEAKRARDERVKHGAPTAKISHEVMEAAQEEQRLHEVQMFKERSMAFLEQKNNDALAKKASRHPMKFDWPVHKYEDRKLWRSSRMRRR